MVEIEGGVGANLAINHLDSLRGCGTDPGSDVGIVIEPGEHDSVTFVPTFGECAAESEGDRGHVGPKDDLFGSAANEIGSGTSSGRNRLARSTRGREISAHVRHRARQGRGDRVYDAVGNLGAGRTVEEDLVAS